MNREQAIKHVGEESVKKVELENCDFTNRVTSGMVEFAADVNAVSNYTGIPVVLRAYYYQKKEVVDATEDLGNLDWKIDHYEVQ